MYRRLKGPAYTRRKYIGGVPNNRIHQFHVGNRRAAETGQFDVVIELRQTTMCRFATRLLRPLVLCPTPPSKGSGGPRLRFASPPSHTSSEKQASHRCRCRPCFSRYAMCLWKERRHCSPREARSACYFDSSERRSLSHGPRRSAQGQHEVPTPCTIRLIRGHEHLKGLI